MTRVVSVDYQRGYRDGTAIAAEATGWTVWQRQTWRDSLNYGASDVTRGMRDAWDDQYSSVTAEREP